jgi:BirA family transcriptional regulator, biotin operon repressor / biotin---[acetyl-CoA-carboxylase] ligase
LLPTPPKKAIGHTIIQLEQINSTNSYAIDKIQANLAAHGMVYFAHHQTQGKGQRGKQWHSEPGSNLILSAVVDTKPLQLVDNFVLSAAVALACHELFNKYARHDTYIKWPNDIYWNDRKAGGILIENIVRGNKWQWAVIGIGININQTQFDVLHKTVSLKQITGATFSVLDLAKELCTFLNSYYQLLLTGNGPALIEAYNAVLYKRLQTVKLKKQATLFECTIQQVTKNGRLQVAHPVHDFFDFGEVEWIIG